MGYFKGKKWPCSFLAVFLVIALMGAFTFSAVEIVPRGKARTAGFPRRSFETVPENIFSAVNYSLDCLAEETVLTGKDQRHSPLSQRFETSRISLSDGINNTGSYCVSSPARVLKKYHIPDSRNTIRVNVRI